MNTCFGYEVHAQTVATRPFPLPLLGLERWLSGQLQDRVNNYRTKWTATGQSEQLQDKVDRYRTEWTTTGQSGELQDRVNNYRTEWRATGQSEQLQDKVESYRTDWTATGQTGQLQDRLDSYRTEWRAKMIYKDKSHLSETNQLALQALHSRALIHTMTSQRCHLRVHN